MSTETVINSNKERLNITYELIMAGLALVVTAVLIIEFTQPLTEEQKNIFSIVDLSILAIFAVDYFFRLIRAQDKIKFFKGNIFDLIAIMPFDKTFRVARLVRLTRLARMSRTSRFTRFFRLTKAARITLFARRLWGTFKGVITTNGLVYVILITFLIILGGAFGIKSVEPGMESFGDAIWWSLVTTTTVGYGDISPESLGGRVLAGFLMIVGIGFLGMVTGSVATYFVDRLSTKQRVKSLKEEQAELLKKKIDELESLSLEDIQLLNRTIFRLWEETVGSPK